MYNHYLAIGGSIMLKTYSDNQTFLDDIRQEFITKTRIEFEKIEKKHTKPTEKKQIKTKHVKSLFFLSEDSYRTIIR